ncbi:MAG: hypothetical protein C0467_01210 [Planctomycetaceae bacterium]|nr:hypothetical protein [Planctomycetaceae bacterium]
MPAPYNGPAPAQYPSPQPVAAYPQPYPAPQAAYPAPAAAQPFQAPPAALQPVPQQVEEVTEAPAAKQQARTGRLKPGSPAAPTGGVPKPVLYGLAGYALLMTILALYGLFMKSGDVPPDHPLSIIPDNFGEFDNAQRKKGAAVIRGKIDGPLPPNQVAQLNGTIEVGGLEIVPLRIEKRTLDLMTVDAKGTKQPAGSTASTLVMRVKVKNNTDLALCPFDPAFSRKGSRDDQPVTRVVVGTEPFAGGPLVWPMSKAGSRQFEKEQERDAEPLKPGETREYTVCATTKPELIPAIKKNGDKIMWRVQVRRGPVAYNGKSVPVTAIFGVEFSRADIQNF